MTIDEKDDQKSNEVGETNMCIEHGAFHISDAHSTENVHVLGSVLDVVDVVNGHEYSASDYCNDQEKPSEESDEAKKDDAIDTDLVNKFWVLGAYERGNPTEEAAGDSRGGFVASMVLDFWLVDDLVDIELLWITNSPCMRTLLLGRSKLKAKIVTNCNKVRARSMIRVELDLRKKHPSKPTVDQLQWAPVSCQHRKLPGSHRYRCGPWVEVTANKALGKRAMGASPSGCCRFLVVCETMLAKVTSKGLLNDAPSQHQAQKGKN